MDEIKFADSADKKELFNRIDSATNRELSIIYKGIAGYDPFEKYKLILPSEIRTRVIKKIKQSVMDGHVLVTKTKT